MNGDPHVVILSHHALLLAVPALLPAVIVAGVVIFVAMRDRRTPSDSDDAEAIKGSGA